MHSDGAEEITNEKSFKWIAHEEKIVKTIDCRRMALAIAYASQQPFDFYVQTVLAASLAALQNRFRKGFETGFA